MGVFPEFAYANTSGKKKILDQYSSSFSCIFFACKYVSEDVSENCSCCNNVHVTSLFGDAAHIPFFLHANTGFGVLLSHELQAFFLGKKIII